MPRQPLLTPGRGGRWSLAVLLALLSCSPAPVPSPSVPGSTMTAPPSDGPPCPEPPDVQRSPIRLHDSPASWPTALSLSPDSRWLALIGEDRQVQVRDARTGKLRASFDAREADLGHEARVESLGWASSGQWLAVRFPDRVVYRDIERGTVARRLRSDAGRHRTETTATFTKGGEQAVTLTRSAPQVHVHDAASGAEVEAVTLPMGRGDQTLRMVPEWPAGRGLLLASEAHLFRVDGGRVQTIVAPRSASSLDPVHAVSPDERTLVMLDENFVRLIDMRSGRQVLGQRLVDPNARPPGQGEDGDEAEDWPIGPSGRNVRWSFSPDSSLLALSFEQVRGASSATVLMLVDVPRHRVRFRVSFENDSRPIDFLFLSDGTLCKRRSTESHDDCLPIQLTTGAQVGPGTFMKDAPPVFRPLVAASPDGQLEATVQNARVMMRATASGRTLWGVPVGLRPTTPDRLAVSDDGLSVAMVAHEPDWRRGRHPWVQVWWASKGSVRTPYGSGPDAAGEAAEVVTVGDRLRVYWRGHAELMTWPLEHENPSTEDTESALRMMRVSPDGAWWASVDEPRALTLHRRQGDEEPEVLSGFETTDVRFTSDPAHVVALGTDGVVRAWPVTRATQDGEWTVGADARLAVSTRGGAVIHAPASSELITLRFDPVQVERRRDGVGRPGTVARAFSPDGSSAVLVPVGGPPVVVDVASSTVRATLRAEEARTEGSVVFHPDSERLATVAVSGAGSVVRVRSARTGQGLLTVPLPGVRPEQVTAAFTVGELVLGYQGQVTYHALDSCKAVALRLVSRGADVGWLAIDAQGHIDGDDAGLRAAALPGPDGLPVADEELMKRRVPGLLFGNRAVARK